MENKKVFKQGNFKQYMLICIVALLTAATSLMYSSLRVSANINAFKTMFILIIVMSCLVIVVVPVFIISGLTFKIIVFDESGITINQRNIGSGVPNENKSRFIKYDDITQIALTNGKLPLIILDTKQGKKGIWIKQVFTKEQVDEIIKELEQRTGQKVQIQ